MASTSVIGRRPNFSIAYCSASADCEKCSFGHCLRQWRRTQSSIVAYKLCTQSIVRKCLAQLGPGFFEVAKEAGAKIDKFTLNGGPTKSRLWNQITSDVTGLPLDLPDVGKSEETGFPPEAAPLGNAILAAVGAGFYSNPLESLKDIVKVKETFEPNMQNHQMYSEFFDVWRSIYHNVIDNMKAHHELLNKYNFS